jgi:hypothetical protein
LPCTTCTYAQNLQDTYNWANWSSGGTALTSYIGSGENPCTDNSFIQQNVDFWNYSTTYNGTVPGVGCGTTRPAVCTVGDGYWETAQSCTSLTGLIGASHTSNITGTFYRCTATNTWTSYFTPYTYPHPLAGGVTAPNAPTNVRIR